MKWFKEVFLPSFKIGETRISEKQFNIFYRYLDTADDGEYTINCKGIIDGKRIWAQEWACKTGKRWYVTIELI